MSETTMKTENHKAADETERTRSGQTYRPNVDIVEHRDELVLVADMPGVNSAELDIRFEDGELSIRGPVAARQAEGTRYLLREYGVGDFYRSFRVSEQIDASRISAEYSDGVLKLRLPKVEAAKPRKIAVAAR